MKIPNINPYVNAAVIGITLIELGIKAIRHHKATNEAKAQKAGTTQVDALVEVEKAKALLQKLEAATGGSSVIGGAQ